ncbi:flagellar assembly protein FliX [Oryzibacter oryziterrae]|uniref:flagellar assembly protein FliX n=1 Tax=Oryzibacter oryziterrae TaxID=2766474 RepID=UPI001F27EAC9|nr:flagellar assembly protein FliX [Oryzibacter oryziterrae]
MRIQGPTRTGGVTTSGPTRRSDASGATFSLGVSEETPKASAPAAAHSLTSLDALIALQAIDADAPRKRRKAVRKGHDILDKLDEIKVGLLSGTLSGDAIERVLGLLDDVETTGDERLDGLIADIMLRAEVELAKLGRYRN